MLDFLYLIFIAPLEFLMRMVLDWAFSWAHSWGWSLFLLSFAVNSALLPIYNRAEGWQEEERALKREMARHEAMLRRTFKGQKRFVLLSALRRQFGYDGGFTIRACMGLALQVPFFLAAYHLLSHFSPLSGQSFGPLTDLGAPDALVSLGGFSVNLLPLLMTVVNLTSAFVYTTGLTSRDRVRIYGIALIFLVLLYDSASALTLYWTLNNVYSLGKNIVEKRLMRRHSRTRAEAYPSLFTTSDRDSLTAACLMGAVCALFFCVFVPLCTYFHNANEFAFNGRDLCRSLAPCCLAVFFACTLVLHAASRFLPCERVKFPWQQRTATGTGVNGAHALCLTLLFLIWLEGTALSYGLPPLDGELNQFTSTFRTVSDSILLLYLLVLAFLCRHMIIEKFFVLLIVFILVTSASLGDAYRTGEAKIDGERFRPAAGLKLVSKDSLYAQLQFSTTNNIIILLVDSLDTLSFEKTLELYPELNSTFDGFWIFQENIGAGGNTHLAVPQILAGKIFDGKMYPEFLEKALIGEESLAADACAHGYKVFIDGDSFQITSGETNKGEAIERNILLKEVYAQFIFKFLPYYGKHLFEKKIQVPGEDPNKKAFNKILKRIDKVEKQPVLQFLYFFGTHLPLIKSDMIETTHELCMDIDSFFAHLKQSGIYDKSVLVVMSDHGIFAAEHDHRSFYPERTVRKHTSFFPLFMLKTPASSGNPVKRRELTSSVYLKDILHLFYTRTPTNALLERYLDSLPASRTIYVPSVGAVKATGRMSTFHLEK